MANRSQNGGTYFHHTNYLGTERMRTDWNGHATSTYASGPFGEGQGNGSGTDTNQDPAGYTGQDHDTETATDHFQYRQYSEMAGRWLSPDPYDGSYDPGDPQSLNRYAYVQNNPLAYVDPDGLDCTIYHTSVDGVNTGDYTSCSDPRNGGPSESTNGVDYSGFGPGGIQTSSGPGGPSYSSQPAPLPPIQNTLKITCNTVLPNGKTVGSYVRDARSRLAAQAAYGNPFTHNVGAQFLREVGPGSPIDFKSNLPSSGPAQYRMLGDAGNFAYYAIGVDFYYRGVLNIGAGVYALLSAPRPSSTVTFDSLTMPYGQDTSAKLEENPGLAANGCRVQ